MNKVALLIKERTENTNDKITCKEISNELGIPAISVRSEINAARSDNIPICSCRYGYYYSEDKCDLEKTIMSMRHRILKQNQAISGLNKAYEG